MLGDQRTAWELVLSSHVVGSGGGAGVSGFARDASAHWAIWPPTQNFKREFLGMLLKVFILFSPLCVSSSLAIIYGVFSASNLITPSVVAIVGPQISMFVSGLFYR